MPKAQTYATHRRWMPIYHFFVMPVLYVNFLIQLWRLGDDRSFEQVWAAVLGAGLIMFGFAARIMALTAQNRAIRIEERLRLMRLLPVEEHGRIYELKMRQLVGLRFAPDEEAPDLARRCMNGDLKTAKDVKQNIRTWRPDYLRV